MPRLKDALAQHAITFASALVAAVASASPDEIGEVIGRRTRGEISDDDWKKYFEEPMREHSDALPGEEKRKARAKIGKRLHTYNC
jgi:hypothetical protein